MLWICWLVRCLSWSLCCEATREFSLGSFAASYLPNSGRDRLDLIAAWPPSHSGAEKSDTSTCFMHKHINTEAEEDTHIHPLAHTQSFEWWKCRLRREEVEEIKWVGAVIAHEPVLPTHTHTYWKAHIHTVLAQICNKMAPLIELISIFGQRDIYTPL